MLSYSKLTGKVWRYKEDYGERGYAMAIEECIREGMELAQYLKRKTQEVAYMFSAEYSYALELEASKEDGIREGIDIGIAKGRAEGRTEGRAEERFFMARSFRDMGVSLDKIAKATGLSEEEIKGL